MKQIQLFSLPVSVSNLNDFTRHVLDQIIFYNKKISILPASMNDLMQSKKGSVFLDSYRSFSYITMDGVPLVWLARLKGEKQAKRVYGPDLMVEIMRLSENRPIIHFLYGGTDRVLLKLEKELKRRFPLSEVAGRYAPPFRELTPKEEKEVISLINSTKPDIIWVGLGGWKQVKWVNLMKSRLDAKAFIAVGAAFDFLSREKPQAPKWMRKFGLEWLFRLMSEPKRLWKRYILQIIPFVIFSLKEVLAYKFLKIRGQVPNNENKKAD